MTDYGPPGIPERGSATSGIVPPIGGTVSTPPPIGASTTTPSSSSSSSAPGSFNPGDDATEGLALFLTFAILGVLATQEATAKFALWVGIALVALVWNNAISSGRAKTFWQSL